MLTRLECLRVHVVAHNHERRVLIARFPVAHPESVPKPSLFSYDSKCSAKRLNLGMLSIRTVVWKDCSYWAAKP